MQGSKLGGQWKVPSLVGNGRFQAWWAMEGSKLSGQWKVPSLVGNERFQVWWPLKWIQCLEANGEASYLVANGMFHAWLPLQGKGEASFLPPSTFYPIRFYLNLFFNIDFRVLFYHGFKPLLHIFPSFSLTYKLQSCISKYQVFHTFNPSRK
jgi:hypothetical protein